ncbi:MAG: hypothetical protein AB7J13_05490 [Pyrinomonadaceae bacterium]
MKKFDESGRKTLRSSTTILMLSSLMLEHVKRLPVERPLHFRLGT